MSFVSPDDDRRPGYVRDSDEEESERALREWAARQSPGVPFGLRRRDIERAEDHE